MSNMENHVVSLEVAKELKGYLPEGFESEFIYRISHYGYMKPDDPGVLQVCMRRAPVSALEDVRETCPAPILSEMLEILPNQINIKDKSSEHRYYRKFLYDSICYSNYKGTALKGINNIVEQEYIDLYEKTINYATAAAKLYMWLIDNKYLEV